MNKTTLLAIAAILWILFFLMCMNAGAQEKLLIAPTRITFDCSKTSHEITISNNSSDTLRYEVLFVEMHMQDNGKLESSLGVIAGQTPASQCVKFAPDRLELAPGQTKTITLTLNADEVKEGESRSHLMLRPERSSLKSLNTSARAVTLPVIVRKGTFNTKLSVLNMTMIQQSDTPVLSVTLGREGNMSAYGNVVISYADSVGHLAPVGGVNGVAIYTPNTQRQFHIPLNKRVDQYDISKLNLEFIAAEGNLLPVISERSLAIQKK